MKRIIQVELKIDSLCLQIHSELLLAPDISSRARIVADYVTTHVSSLDRDDVMQATLLFQRELFMVGKYCLSLQQPLDLSVTLIKASGGQGDPDNHRDHDYGLIQVREFSCFYAQSTSACVFKHWCEKKNLGGRCS